MQNSQDLSVAIRSQVPIVVIETLDEPGVLEVLDRVCESLRLPHLSWSVTDGFVVRSSPDPKLSAFAALPSSGGPALLRLEDEDAGQSSSSSMSVSSMDALRRIRSENYPAVFSLLDFHPYLVDPIQIRLIKEIALGYTAENKTLVFVGHSCNLPEELVPYSLKFNLRTPRLDELGCLVDELLNDLKDEQPFKRGEFDPHCVQLLKQSLRGLSSADVKRLVRQAVLDDGVLTLSDVDAVMKARASILNRHGVLSYEARNAQFSDVAGLSGLKKWLAERQSAFRGERNALGLSPLKGILLLGVPGCGKSLAAKAVAGTWHLPLLRFDLATAFSKFLGQTEQQFRDALTTAEVLAPCVLWIDEIEKAIGSSDFDGGTATRVLGMLLTWMSERVAPVFVVATANAVDSLPPELMRKGRFDEVFFIDLPDAQSRAAILEIHLTKRKLDPQQFDLPILVRATENFSGSEIEQGVVSAIYRGLSAHTTVTTEILLQVLAETRPLATLMGEKIVDLRSWALDRTVPAD